MGLSFIIWQFWNWIGNAYHIMEKKKTWVCLGINNNRNCSHSINQFFVLHLFYYASLTYLFVFSSILFIGVRGVGWNCKNKREEIGKGHNGLIKKEYNNEKESNQ